MQICYINGQLNLQLEKINNSNEIKNKKQIIYFLMI